MDKRTALNILCNPGCTMDELKTAYRKACLSNHPDHGGDLEAMKLVNAAYDFLKVHKWTMDDMAPASDDSILDCILERWSSIKHWPNITGEVCGTWIWVTGQTWRYKKQLKSFGFRWSQNKSSWYWHPAGYKKRSRRSWGLEDIRDKFGSSTLQTAEVYTVGGAA